LKSFNVSTVEHLNETKCSFRCENEPKKDIFGVDVQQTETWETDEATETWETDEATDEEKTTTIDEEEEEEDNAAQSLSLSL
jgi:hypothetical protein